MIARPLILIDDDSAHLRRQHRENDVLIDAAALQADQLFRIEFEVAGTVVDDCDDRLLFEAGFDESDNRCIREWTIRLLAGRAGHESKGTNTWQRVFAS